MVFSESRLAPVLDWPLKRLYMKKKNEPPLLASGVRTSQLRPRGVLFPHVGALTDQLVIRC